MQCGRKVDVLKLWLMWKAEGDVGMEQAVDKAFDNARYKIITFRHIKALYQLPLILTALLHLVQ